MTAIIHPFPTATQTQKPDFWGIVEDNARIRLRHQDLKSSAQKFGRDVLDYAAISGDAYLKQAATQWLEALAHFR